MRVYWVNGATLAPVARARPSIEEKMEALKPRKRDLAASIFAAEGGSALDLTEADIEELFAPVSAQVH